MSDVICPECGAVMVLRKTKVFTYKDGTPRSFYGCSNYPDCRATHGEHPDGRPFGVPGNAEVKALRHEGHRLFGLVMHYNNWTYDECYSWLAARMGIDKYKCHFGMFGKEQCERAIVILNKEIGV